MSNRRQFIQTAGWLAAWPVAARHTLPSNPTAAEPIKPPRLRVGQTVGIVSPASATLDAFEVSFAEERLAALGLKSRRGAHVLDRRGYLAGADVDRADDVNRMFADPEIDAILCLRGGWGSARLLPHLDFDTIRTHPKLLSGFSDVTSLLLALYARCGMVSLHGPDGLVSWNQYATDYFTRLSFEAELVRMVNPTDEEDDLTRTEDRVVTITRGRASGRLVGGNLTVLTSIIGSPFLPSFDDHILFLEDVGEDIYRVDRMLTQLKLAGLLDGIAGFVFGKCTRCEADSGGYASFTLHEVLSDHIAPLGIPAWHGAMIGHIRRRWSIPIGIRAEIDSSEGSITLLEPAVR